MNNINMEKMAELKLLMKVVKQHIDQLLSFIIFIINLMILISLYYFSIQSSVL